MQDQYIGVKVLAIVGSILIMLLLSMFGAIGEVQAQEGSAKYDTPAGILKAVKSQGASNVVQQINKQWPVLHNILKQIATGKSPWLDVAKALRPGGNAAVIQMMQYAVGEALNHNPKNVLQFAGKDFDLIDICGTPDINDMRFDSYETSISEMKQRRAKVAKVRGKLRKKAKKCLEYLKEADGELAQLFYVNKK